jgi:hypothetical protein
MARTSNGRRCLVCQKPFGSNFKVKKHYDKTKCGAIRKHKRFSHFKSSKAVENAIQEWKRTGKVPENPRHRAKPLAELPTVRRQAPRRAKMQINFCPNCGFEVRGILK